MDARAHAAQIIVLNGPSSAGKTTLARATRIRLGERGVAVSLDDFFTHLNPGVKNNWHLFSTLSEAAFATAAVFAGRGFTVIVDTVFERLESLQAAEHAFASHIRHYVAVTCPLQVLEAREAARGNRQSGQARRQHERVLQDATYALRLDTSQTSIDDCVTRIVALLESS